MIHEIAPILNRNQGNQLTPELINGLLASIEIAANTPIKIGNRIYPLPEHESYESQRIITQRDFDIAGWVAQQLGTQPFSSFTSLGWTDGNGDICAGVVIEQFTSVNAFIHVAATKARWAQYPFIRAFFRYVFVTCGLKRITGTVAMNNEKALRFNLHIGFEIESVMKDGSDDGDVAFMVMWRDKCRWIEE